MYGKRVMAVERRGLMSGELGLVRRRPVVT